MVPANPGPESVFPKAADIRAILRISLPLVFGYLGKIAIGFTDNIMVGHLGSEALGAMGLAAAVYAVFLMIGTGLLFSVMVLVSQARGAGRALTIPGIIRQGIWISGALSVPACIVLWNLDDILVLTGQKAMLAGIAGHYMDYYLWTMFPAFSSLVFILALTAMGRTEIVLLIAWLEVGLNIILNYLLIFGKFGFPAMGVAGAGLASVIIHGIGCAIFFVFFDFHKLFRRRPMFRRAWRPRWTMIGRILKLGWPKGLEMIINKSLFSVATLLAGWLGVKVVTAHTIAFQTSLIVFFIVSIPLADAVTARIGIAAGRESRAGMWRILVSALLLFLLFILPAVVILAGFPEWIVALFIGFETPNIDDLVAVTSPLIILMAVFVIADGLRIVTDRALNGLADMKVPALIAALSHWGVGFSLGVMFGFVMDGGIVGLWLGLTIGMFVATLLYLARFGWLIRKLPI
uniref:Multidrug-efflux transporter n=1 Tax=Candidatus Kentrum sp. FW TaxID=2126338 RepID=A0A450SN17_9GAMM|nr:MAG: multidrug resistance protein, MATE family [Candidatus Kentron sp. FW]